MNHSFSIESAAKYGVIEAILYENIIHWLRINKANESNIKDGKVWTYNSVQAYAKLFSYLSAKQIRRALESLVKQGAIVKGEYNQANYDKTSWYSVPDESVLSICPDGQAIGPKGQMDMPKRANRSAQAGEPIPDINTDVKPDTTTHASAPDNPLDIKPKGIPEQLLKPLAEYEKLRSYGGIGHVMIHVNGAVAMVGVDIVLGALKQVLSKAQEPGYDPKYTPALVTLLRDKHKLIDRAAQYRPAMREPEYEPKELSPEAGAALEILLAEMSA